MPVRRYGLLLLLFLLGWISIASAREITPSERQSLESTAAAFDAAIKVSDYGQIMSVVPPRVLQHLADKAAITVDELLKIASAQLKTVSATVKIESFGMNMADASYKEASNGEPYVLIP